MEALSYLVRSLELIFIHCGKKFINRENADKITQPLVNQVLNSFKFLCLPLSVIKKKLITIEKSIINLK